MPAVENIMPDAMAITYRHLSGQGQPRLDCRAVGLDMPLVSLSDLSDDCRGGVLIRGAPAGAGGAAGGHGGGAVVSVQQLVPNSVASKERAYEELHQQGQGVCESQFG